MRVLVPLLTDLEVAQAAEITARQAPYAVKAVLGNLGYAL